MQEAGDHELPPHRAGLPVLPVLLAILVVLLAATLWKSPPKVDLPEYIPVGTAWAPLDAEGWLNVPEGETYDLNASMDAGKVVFIDFMASYCGPCLAEMPRLAKLAKQYGPSGVEFVSLTMETGRDVPKIKKFLAASPGADWPVAYGAEEVLSAFQIPGFPTYALFVDGRAVWSGDSRHDLQAALDSAVAIWRQ